MLTIWVWATAARRGEGVGGLAAFRDGLGQVPDGVP
jgi:hypothetical protein